MRCIIIDDEYLARKGMEKFVSEVPSLQLAASCRNPIEAMEVLSREHIDLLFLDIQMPKMTGIDFLKNSRHLPLTIITTAYPEYALVGYELDVIDYLLKPIPFDRFVKAVNKAVDYLQIQQPPGDLNEIDYMFIKCNNKYERVNFEDILYIEAMQNYVVVHLENRKLLTYATIKSVEEHLPESKFIKVNKSNIISLQKVSSVQGNEVVLGKQSFVIGRSSRERVMERILGNSLLKRK